MTANWLDALIRKMRRPNPNQEVGPDSRRSAIADDVENLRKRLQGLEARADNLQNRYEKLIGKADEFTPRTNAIMRAGIPLEIFSRQSLIEANFEVFGIYPFEYINRQNELTERSVDIYGARDTVYTVPEGSGQRSGESWPERIHLLVEIKQRRKGVEWVFSTLPISMKQYSIAGAEIPVANSAFELRANESGSGNSVNPNDVNNAISQLNQSYMPFKIGLITNLSIEFPGMSKQYAIHNGRDHVWLLLITNTPLKYFTPPDKFSDIGLSPDHDSVLFKEVPWVAFQPEPSLSLKYHQRESIKRAKEAHPPDAAKGFPPPTAFGAHRFQSAQPAGLNWEILEYMINVGHEIHIVNYNYLSKFLELVNDPPRIKKIQFELSVDGKHRTKFEIGDR